MKKCLLGSSALAGVSGLALAVALGLAPDARANDECGAVGAGGTATCTPAGNNFPNGIEYQVTDLTIVVQDGVIIDTTGVAAEPGGIVSGGAGNYGNLAITAGTGAGAGITITTDEPGASGVFAATDNGTATITTFSTITTQGDDAEGIHAYSKLSGVSVTSNGDIATGGYSADGIFARGYNSGQITSIGDIATTGKAASGIFGSVIAGTLTVSSQGDISVQGDLARGIQALGIGGDAVTSKGDISTKGSLGATGIVASALGGTVTINSTGAISTQGEVSSGISGSSLSGVVVINSTGNISTVGDESYGITGSALNGVTITSAGAISTKGEDADGLEADSKDGNVALTSTGGISTLGKNADGIGAYAGNGTVTITSTGAITTAGISADGIEAFSSKDKVTVDATGNISTKGDGTFGILANGATSAAVTAQGRITALGDASSGILATGITGNVVISQAGSILAPEDGSHGIVAIAAGSSVTIDISGDVEGGWGAGEGIFVDALNASTLNVDPGGSVGALSDLAIEDGGEKLIIANQGTITGTLSLGGGDDGLINVSPTTWNLRDFADTDGDGQRDTESVAIADFGAGNDTVANIGTLRLATVSGATKWDTTGQLTHPAGGNADITQNGVEQGQLVNLELFINSGAITLVDGTAGDLLAITDAAAPGAGGGNTFRSSGGSLALDVVLDDGSSQQSDMLVLDNATTGAGGATRVFIAGQGAGAQTTGDGIQVVNVDGTSSADAFAQGGPAVAGAYQYDLFFQNQAKTDQNWYLRSSFFEGALDYPAIQTGALSTWYSDLGPLHERLGERRRAVAEGQTAELPSATDMADSSAVRVNESGQGGWFRVVGADMDIEQDGPADINLNTVRAEAGFDVGFDDLLGEDWLVLGALAGYGWSSVALESDADIDFNIATIGAYATYFRGPYYLDALVKFDWLDGDYNSDAVSRDGDVELPVIGLSLESGYRLDLTQGGLYLQPQAQLAFAHVGDDSFKDDSGSKIELEDADSLRGRLGARLGQELPSDGGDATGNFYLEASVLQEFLGDTEAKVSGLTLEQELPGTSFEIGGGFDIALPKDGVTFTLDADYSFGREVDGIGATGGIRISW